ncbi:hypothetical protein C5C37_02730 [Rathayibacter sp. AY1F9]|nr:hypothetical protein C5C37_02730 [Rathayibacter sp. AY1F9]
MVRGALWLLQEVHEGQTFTKNQLREAFPGVSQVDRRVRDLRSYGWIIHSSTEDASLTTEDQRFVKEGVAVWDAEERRRSLAVKSLPSKERQAVLARDGFMCTLCGIAGAESYPDDSLMTAVLAVSRRILVMPDRSSVEVLVTECARCRAGRVGDAIEVQHLVTAASELTPGDYRRLRRWIERGRRGQTDLDRAWASYLRIPADRRSEIGQYLQE